MAPNPLKGALIHNIFKPPFRGDGGLSKTGYISKN